MKIALFGIADIKLGKHNLKDPRLDQADKLVEADKKTQAQADVIGEDQLLDADAILATQDTKADLILKDLEFVETRLGRDPQPAERAALEKIKALLERERFLSNSGLSTEDLQAVAAHSFYTNKPITVASRAELQEPRRAAAAGLRGCRLHLVPDRRRQGEPRLADSQRHHRLGSGGHDPYGHPEGLYPRGGYQLRGFHRSRRRDPGQAGRQAAPGTETVCRAGLRPRELPLQQMTKQEMGDRGVGGTLTHHVSRFTPISLFPLLPALG